MEKVYQWIKNERKWQDENRPEFKPDLMFPILVEEVGEVGKAIQDDNWENYRDELVQVAAVAVRILEWMETQNSSIRKSAV